MRILLVEDEKPLSAAIVKMLEQEHFALDAAYTGPDGLDCVLSGIYDAIVLDVMLPGMDGFCRAARAAAAGRFYAGADADRPRRRAGSRAGAEPGRGLLTCPSPLNAASWWLA
ncbi:MAG: response regulator [Christensenellales bacterium]